MPRVARAGGGRGARGAGADGALCCRQSGGARADGPRIRRFFLLIIVVVLLLPASLLKEAGEEQATQAPTARHAAANQEAREPMVLRSAAFFLLIIIVAPLSASLLKEAGQEQATQAPTARYAATDQEAREPMVLGSATFLPLLIIVVVVLPASLLKEAGQEQAAQAPTARHAAANQESLLVVPLRLCGRWLAGRAIMCRMTLNRPGASSSRTSRCDLSPMSRAAQRKSGTAALPVKPPMAEILTAGLCHYLLKTPILGPASGR